jgi:hypothetical protein
MTDPAQEYETLLTQTALLQLNLQKAKRTHADLARSVKFL